MGVDMYPSIFADVAARSRPGREPHMSLRRLAAISVTLVLSLAACGDSDVGDATTPDGPGSDPATTSDIDVCSLLTSAELQSVLGEAPLPKASEPAGPFTGCSWGTGDIIVSIAPSETVILAPGEDECPSAQLGDDSYACEGRVKFLINGLHVTVSTIDPFMDDTDLLALAQVVLPKLAA